jgi:hypothetical protein
MITSTTFVFNGDVETYGLLSSSSFKSMFVATPKRLNQQQSNQSVTSISKSKFIPITQIYVYSTTTLI